MSDGEKNPWTILESRVAYDNPWVEVTEHQVRNPQGGDGIYGVVHFKHLALGILPLSASGEIYLVGQYRFPLGAYSWEIPEGGGALDTDPLDSARRELLEETGLRARDWEPFMTMHTSNSVCDEKCLVFLATGLSQHEAEPEETEALRVRRLPFAEAVEMVLNGLITDAISVAAILRLKVLLDGGTPWPGK